MFALITEAHEKEPIPFSAFKNLLDVAGGAKPVVYNLLRKAKYYYWIEDPFHITQDKIYSLFVKPLISTKEWQDRTEIINLRIDLLLRIDFLADFRFPDYHNDVFRQLFRFKFVMENASILKDKEINFEDLRRY
jgi:hypothetical protein